MGRRAVLACLAVATVAASADDRPARFTQTVTLKSYDEAGKERFGAEVAAFKREPKGRPVRFGLWERDKALRGWSPGAGNRIVEADGTAWRVTKISVSGGATPGSAHVCAVKPVPKKP